MLCYAAFLDHDTIAASQQDNKSNKTFGASPLSTCQPFETWHCEHFYLSMQKTHKGLTLGPTRGRGCVSSLSLD